MSIAELGITVISCVIADVLIWAFRFAVDLSERVAHIEGHICAQDDDPGGNEINLPVSQKKQALSLVASVPDAKFIN